ncbi:MAG TPA: FAD:protein FMN transferase [Ancylobacter sp.]
MAASPASVTVVSATCIIADAWATALMVWGSREGVELSCRQNLDALFIDRDGDTRVGCSRLVQPSGV